MSPLLTPFVIFICIYRNLPAICGVFVKRLSNFELDRVCFKSCACHYGDDVTLLADIVGEGGGVRQRSGDDVYT